MRFGKTPHPIPYQGSKRQLAPLILSFIPYGKFERLVEPFVGSGAVTLAAAREQLCKGFLVSDALAPLCDLWRNILAEPHVLAGEYARLWGRQQPDPISFFNKVRQEFNSDHHPAKLLFLLARCVKNAVRFNPSGEFNQSADKRRLGTKPGTMKAEIEAAYQLLRGKCEVLCGDYKTTLEAATPDDVAYLDPPYQGTSQGRDSRYIKGVDRDDLVVSLDRLNKRGVQFILSYDGSCGDKTYGEPLPTFLNVTRVLVDAGRSTQATLNGRDHRTVESIYLSSALASAISLPEVVNSNFVRNQSELFARA